MRRRPSRRQAAMTPPATAIVVAAIIIRVAAVDAAIASNRNGDHPREKVPHALPVLPRCARSRDLAWVQEAGGGADLNFEGITK